MRPGETPLHEVLKREADGTWVIDKVADQMWVVPSIWGMARAVGREQGWDFSYRMLFNAAYGLMSALGFSPRYVAIDDVKAPQRTRFTTTLASGEVVNVKVRMKMGFWTGRSLALHTWTWFRSHPVLGQLELSLPLRLTKAGVVRLYAASGSVASKMDFAIFRARFQALRIVFNRLPVAVAGDQGPPLSIEQLMDHVYRVSYLAEAERADEATRKVPELLSMDHAAIPEAYLLALWYFLTQNREIVSPVVVGSRGEISEIEPEDITPDNFWQVHFYKRAELPGGAPDPEGPVCKKSFRYTMLGNIVLGVMVGGREGTLAYGNRKLEANHAVIYATGEPVRLTSLLLGRWKIPWLNLEIPIPGGRGSILWALIMYKRKKIGLGGFPI